MHNVRRHIRKVRKKHVKSVGPGMSAGTRKSSNAVWRQGVTVQK